MFDPCKLQVGEEAETGCCRRRAGVLRGAKGGVHETERDEGRFSLGVAGRRIDQQ